MYAVRIKLHDGKDWLYSNHNFLMSRKEIDEGKQEYTCFKDFLLNKQDAEKLYIKFLLKRDDLPIKAVALVDMSNYAPYPEHTVEKYQEKK